jgi:molybdopterin-guanine dinucleotide biosynthesis protein A
VYGNRTVPVKDAAEVTLVIQAGGRGTRLGGVPKGLIRLGNDRVIDRLVGLGEARRWPTWIIANLPEPYAELDVPIAGDVVPERGAPGGVVTALALAGTEWVLTVACDMPFVTQAAIDALLCQRSREVDVVCFERGGRLEPLLGLYRRSLLPAFAAGLDGRPSLQSLIRNVRCRILEPDDPTVLDSLNTPDDLQRVKAAIR